MRLALDVGKVGEGGVDGDGVDDVFHVDVSEGDVPSVSVSSSTSVGRAAVAFTGCKLEVSGVVNLKRTQSKTWRRHPGTRGIGRRGRVRYPPSRRPR